jgi:AcrR family transcriptional regulator
MTEKTIDRRVLRTRAMLHDALISLFLRKDYETITIQDIVDEANVGRSTFYAHYTSKEDLLRSGFESLRGLLIDQQKDAFAKRQDIDDRSLGFCLAMFEHAGGHIELYRALVGGRGGVVALESIRRILSDLVRDELTASHGEEFVDAIPHELVIQYVVGAFMSVLTWWLDRDAKIPAEQIGAMFQRLTHEGIFSGNLTD